MPEGPIIAKVSLGLIVRLMSFEDMMAAKGFVEIGYPDLDPFRLFVVDSPAVGVGSFVVAVAHYFFQK